MRTSWIWMLAPKAGPSACCLTALALLAVQPAEAREARVAVDVAAGPLSRSLQALAAQTSISIGMAGPLPAVTTRAVRGRMTPAQALERLLSGTGLRAIPAGDGAYRLVSAAPPPPPPPARRAPAPAPPPPVARPTAPLPAADIVVTALRQPQRLFSAPAAITVLPAAGFGAGAAALGSRDVAARIDGLTLTNLGEGRNRQYIRGVADSAFNGYSQSTVAVVLDGSRITYDAPDPDLRLVDVDRVEVLKGPQGPLYGSGALGGVYHVVTHRPDPDATTATVEAYGSALGGGGAGGGGSAVLNLPILRGSLAIRGSAYGAIEPGWIDNEGGPDNANVGRVSGGRVALRWLPLAGWTVDVGATAQFITVDDSQYVPAQARSYRRPAALREPHDNDIRLVSTGVSGPIGRLRLDATASFVRHEVGSSLDASAAAAAFGEAPPLGFQDDRKYRVLDQEARLSGGAADHLSWIVGISYLSASTRVEAMVEPPAAPARPVVRLSRQASEMAIYGQGSLALSPRLRWDVGLRLFRSVSEDDLEEGEGSKSSARLAEKKTGVAPSLSLSWSAAKDIFLYARFAQAERAAGLGAQVSGAPARFGSDHLASFELGGRLKRGIGSIEGAVFHGRWADVQSDYLLPSGLIATHNAGDAAIWGAELSARLDFDGGWSLDAGGVAQSALLKRSPDGGDLPEDRRLPVVPAIALRARVARQISLGGWRGSVESLVRYNGSQRLSFDPGLDRKSAGYFVLGAGARLAKGPWSWALDLTNLLGSKADTFGFGNPFSVRLAPQYTPLRPAGATLSLRRIF